MDQTIPDRDLSFLTRLLCRASAEKKNRESAEERAAKSAKEAEDKKMQAEKEIEDMMADLRNKLKTKDK